MVNRERIHPKDYEPLLDLIDKNKLIVDGDAIERTIIDRYITSNQKEHLSEIQVPILS